MANPTDFYSDVNQQTLYTIDRLVGLPQFAKQAEARPDKTLTSDVFADMRRKKFPCHTKAATWLANAYFQLAKSSYTKDECLHIQDRITKFAEHWRISSLVKDFTETWTKISSFQAPSNVPDEQYALIYKSGDTVVKRMPMPNPASVKMAAEYLYANRHQYTYPMRKFAARRILSRMIDFDEAAAKGTLEKSASVFGVQLNLDTQEYLERAAGLGINHPVHVATKIAERCMLIKRSFKELGVKLAEISLAMAEKDPVDVTPEELQKLAEIIDGVDRETGLCRFYKTSELQMPEEFLFDILEKEAAAAAEEHVKLTTGGVYPMAYLATLPMEKISAVMGDEFAQAVKDSDGSFDMDKFAELAPTLPRDEAVLLEKAIKESYADVFSKEAASPKAGHLTWSKEETEEFLKKNSDGKVETRDFSLATKLKHPQSV